MILDFPGYDSLQQALMAGLIPAAAVSAPTSFVESDDEHVLVNLEATLDKAALKSLSALGIRKRRLAVKNLTQQTSCWAQILPLISREPATNEKTAVIFDVPAGEAVGEVVAEMLRLGNDRQAFRILGSGDSQRVLLRVTGPPYYSLLRALDQPTVGEKSDDNVSSSRDLTAYIEQAPRVWIQIGVTHPLVAHLKPPTGKLLFISRAGGWQLIPEAPFQDIYNAVDLLVPNVPTDFVESQLESKLQVPLRLVRGGSSDVSEMWVLNGSAVEQLDEFVRTSDERLIGRLSFAVASPSDVDSNQEAGAEAGPKSIIIRLRPGRESAPVLVLDGLACESYLKLPNLFVPSGHRLHPPLRRDVVKKLLADSPGTITWLEPTASDAGNNGEVGTQSFVPRRVPDAAFRPLEDWVDYVLDREHEVLEAWMQSSKFNFESFVCPDEQPDQRQRKKAEPRDSRPKRNEKTRADQQSDSSDKSKPAKKKTVESSESKPRKKHATTTGRRKPAELEKRLKELEAAFIELDAPLDSSERESMWVELAQTNAALKLNNEASICWTHSFWEHDLPSLDDAEQWFEIESQLWPDREGLLNEASVGETLDRMLAVSNASPLEMNTLAAWLVLTASRLESSAPEPKAIADVSVAAIVERLGKLQHHLERYEPMLAVRTAWLAWCGYVKVSQGDVLAVARARDRLLERLFQHGLTPDRDVPSFLRAKGMQSGDRFRAVRDQIVELRPIAKKWSKKHRKAAAETTDQYIDLVFAFAMGRLGEATAAKELLAEVQNSLAEVDAVHGWAVSAYAHRINQAAEGRAAMDPLPDSVMEQLETLGRLDRYKLDRLRQHSSILEPHEKIDPFRRWHQRFNDDLARELAQLADTRDRDELTQHMTRLLAENKGAEQRQQVVATALQVGPRLGEVIARDVLNEAFEILDQLEDATVLDQAVLLEGGLFLAAHFDQSEAVGIFVDRLHNLLEAQQDTDAETIQTLQTLLTQSFRGMRKLGMRDNIARLLDQMAKLVRSAEEKLKTSPRQSRQEEQASLLTTMMQVAGGWFFFGQTDNAWPVMNEVRDLLLSGELPAVPQKKLACAYASALGQAPVEDAIPRFTQLFQKLKGIQDSFTTNTHFSLSHLGLLEAVLQSMVSDDFAMNDAGRRWLDDDEFLIRRRIHRDVRTAMQQEV